MDPPFPSPRGGRVKNIQLNFTDIYSLYPGQGISDAVIDFYRRYVSIHVTYAMCMKEVYTITGQCCLTVILRANCAF